MEIKSQRVKEIKNDAKSPTSSTPSKSPTPSTPSHYTF